MLSLTHSFVPSVNLSYMPVMGWDRHKAEIEGLPLYFDILLENLIIFLWTTRQRLSLSFPRGGELICPKSHNDTELTIIGICVILGMLLNFSVIG